MQEGSTPSGASCLADDLLLHTEGPDAVLAVNIMVNAIAPILKRTGLEVHMISALELIMQQEYRLRQTASLSMASYSPLYPLTSLTNT